MKLKSLLLVCCLGLFSSAFAVNTHYHPQAGKNDNVKNSVSMPGLCEIEINNFSYEDFIVSGQFNDGTPLIPFYIYVNDAPHYISLFYNGRCSHGMMINITNLAGYPIYSQYTPRYSTINIIPNYLKQPKAELKIKR
ncbi:Uncharacterised protein (plasmid) [Legionella adelaidensis]|uniref:Secreted protein n=1 Tax=Legionella adelaidensis TaxID=45056 RepID=A0A0W0R530_9GAMM|nr:hypothetical protein [Legionella adelaidensis]KTC66179.1 hypothetical protein Lade_0837 [Legionella adelaidensis]VEH85578.1 Uncharacterised protein [Legionella adelaidensis]